MTTGQLGLDLGLVRVHCFACPHVVEDTDPREAHDRMEGHYAAVHAALIARILGS